MAGIEDQQSAKAEAKRLECPEDEIYSFVTFGSKREILTNTKIKVCGIASKDKIDQFVFSMKNRETEIKTFFVVTKSDLSKDQTAYNLFKKQADSIGAFLTKKIFDQAKVVEIIRAKITLYQKSRKKENFMIIPNLRIFQSDQPEGIFYAMNESKS